MVPPQTLLERITTLNPEELDKRFIYHPPKPGQPEIYAAIRAEAKQLATLINQHCPESRELKMAIAHVEEAVMWANAGIGRNT